MILAENLTMLFQTANMEHPFRALDNLSCRVPSGCIYGLVGANGSGKSTLMRLISGVYKPHSGKLEIDGEAIWENPKAKARVAYIPDELYFLPQSDLQKMAEFYRSVYPAFDTARFDALAAQFGLDKKTPLNNFSKGMKRQAATILGLSTMADYLLFDETFDGLDPVMRRLVKKTIYNDILERQTTAIITSHSLRELEDTCDQLALLHEGGIVFESDVERLKTSLYKVQIAFDTPFTKERFAAFHPLSFEQQGRVAVMILRGDRDTNEKMLRALNPLLCDLLPLNLEEIFLYETEALGYQFEDTLTGGVKK